jgi:DNA polymerase III epsilon subunit-like protein
VTADLELADAFQSLIHQDAAHVNDHRARYAFSLADLTPAMIAEAPERETQVAIRFRAWCNEQVHQHGVNRSTAFNAMFDFSWLNAFPWQIHTYLPSRGCIMLATMDLMEERGVCPQKKNGGGPKWPKSTEAAAYFRSLGHVVNDDGHHRALPDAIREAQIAVALLREKYPSTYPTPNL